MEYTLRVLLLVCLPLVGNPASLGTDSREGFTDVITDIIESYNKERGKTFLFKILKVEETNGADETRKPIETSVLIQETVCSKHEHARLEDCVFKDDGEIKKCRISVDPNETFTIRCGDPPGVSDGARDQEFISEDVSRPGSIRAADDMKVPKIECLECIFTKLPG